MSRGPLDFQLKYTTIPVEFLDGTEDEARAEGNNAAWECPCGQESLFLIGRCYYQFSDTCYSVCPSCGRRYRVYRDEDKRACLVKEF